MKKRGRERWRERESEREREREREREKALAQTLNFRKESIAVWSCAGSCVLSLRSRPGGSHTSLLTDHSINFKCVSYRTM